MAASDDDPGNEETSVSGRKLRRALGFWALVAFGVGDILGAGIYALVGEIAAVAGHASWIAFAVALVVAGLTALSYAELGGRFPKSGGEAFFCEQGFRSPRLAIMTGWLVLCSGIVSMATLSRAFGGYLLGSSAETGPVAEAAVAALFLGAIAVVNFWGIRQTSLVNILFTLIEAAGLVIVLVVGWRFLAGGGGGSELPLPSGASEANPDPVIAWIAILQAATLAFFAFIGFEDMVNVAEEARNPRRHLPIAIVTAVVLTGGIYLMVIRVATEVVDPAVLGESRAPLLEVVTKAAPEFPPGVFTAIALFAVGNTALLNFVTASRLLFGMSGQKLVPAWLGGVHARTRTPHRAIVTVLILAIILAVTGTLSFLAGTTSLLILLVFVSVNASLIAVKWRERKGSHSNSGTEEGEPRERFRIPGIIPILALASCLGLIVFVPAGAFLRGAVLIAIGAGLMFWRGKNAGQD